MHREERCSSHRRSHRFPLLLKPQSRTRHSHTSATTKQHIQSTAYAARQPHIAQLFHSSRRPHFSFRNEKSRPLLFPPMPLINTRWQHFCSRVPFTFSIFFDREGYSEFRPRSRHASPLLRPVCLRCCCRRCSCHCCCGHDSPTLSTSLSQRCCTFAHGFCTHMPLKTFLPSAALLAAAISVSTQSRCSHGRTLPSSTGSACSNRCSLSPLFMCRPAVLLSTVASLYLSMRE